MALFANDNEETIDAWDAIPKKSYFCLECGKLLKVRKTKTRFPHFYHVKPTPSCRLYSKSKEHHLIQLEIQKILPQGETTLEKQFPSIHRIADLAWDKQKIVFEIQCSAISEKEARERNLEYQSIGYEVIWILDDRHFNKKKLRPAEAFLRKQSSYFVSCKNKIAFYDQLEIFAEHKRVKKGGFLPLCFSFICETKGKQWPKNLPALLEARTLSCKYYFENDALARSLLSIRNPSIAYALQNWILNEKQLSKKQSAQNIFLCFAKLYTSLFNKLFEFL